MQIGKCKKKHVFSIPTVKYTKVSKNCSKFAENDFKRGKQ